MTILIYSYFIAMVLSIIGILYETFSNKSMTYTWLDLMQGLFIACLPMLNYVMTLWSIWLFWSVIANRLDTPIRKKS